MDDSVDGRYRPSSELAFHRAIYRQRPDIRAVRTRTPAPGLIFDPPSSPDTRVLAEGDCFCGKVRVATFAMAGTEDLGHNVAEVFAAGCDSVILENHGVKVGGKTLWEAYGKLEALDFCARILIRTSLLGNPTPLSEKELAEREHAWHFTEGIGRSMGLALPDAGHRLPVGALVPN